MDFLLLAHVVLVAAVLLGADGMLAGGPVHGIEEVRGFVDDIADEIAASAV